MTYAERRLQNALRMGKKNLTLLGQGDTARRSMEKLAPQVLLQRRELATERRLVGACHDGGSREAATPGDGHERVQVLMKAAVHGESFPRDGQQGLKEIEVPTSGR